MQQVQDASEDAWLLHLQMKLDQAEICLGRATVDAQEYKALTDAKQDTQRKWQIHHESELAHLAKLHQKQLTQVEQDKHLENQSLAESVEKLHMKVERLKRMHCMIS